MRHALSCLLNRLTCGFRRVPWWKPSVSPKEPIGFLGGTHWFLRRHPLVSSAAPKRFWRGSDSLITPGESQTLAPNSQKKRYHDSFTHHFCCFFIIFFYFFVVFLLLFRRFLMLFRRFFADFAKYLSFYHTIYHFTQYCKSIRYNENDRMIDDFTNCKVELIP